MPDFLSATHVRELSGDLVALKRAGQFTQAGTGYGEGRGIRSQIRRDEIYWLDEVSANPVQASLWIKINALKQALNRVLYLGLNAFEGHYASYAEGGFYKKHLDSFQADPTRLVTLIVYLNQEWQAKDGGILRVYPENSQQDIAPLGGTLVCFLSRELPHEVLLNHALRLSFSGWFQRLELAPGRT